MTERGEPAQEERGPRDSSGRRGSSAGRSRGGAGLRAECVRCAKPVGRQAGGRRGDEACGVESQARCPDTGHSRTEDIGQTVWSACAWSPAAIGRRGPAERRGNVGGRTAKDSFEARTDTAAAGRLARHPASGDVPTPIRPVARPGSPSPLPGTYLVGPRGPRLRLSVISGGGPLLVGPLSPLTAFDRHFGGGV